MPPSTARRVWEALEPVHAFVYFAPEPKAEYDALGLEPISQYFASRSAPMGAVSHGVVAAAFYNFSPGLVQRAMRDAWSTATPAQVLEARHAGVLAALERFTAGTEAKAVIADITELVTRSTAELVPAGRPLFGGHLSLPVPGEPLLAMWHQLTLLREHRGDGHVIALVAEGFEPMDALVTSAGWSKLPMPQLRKLRGWRPEHWEQGEARLVERGWITPDGTLTDEGAAARVRVERLTDELAMAPLRALGERDTERLIELLGPVKEAVRAGDGLPPT